MINKGKQSNSQQEHIQEFKFEKSFREESESFSVCTDENAFLSNSEIALKSNSL